MKFLIDNNISPVVATLLNDAGHEAVHVRDYGLHAATDVVVLGRARDEGRVVVSADTDFGTLLAHQQAMNPSVLLIRKLVGRRAVEQAEVILANLDATLVEDLDAGAVAVLSDQWVRVRRLPI